MISYPHFTVDIQCFESLLRIDYLMKNGQSLNYFLIKNKMQEHLKLPLEMTIRFG